MEHHPPHNREAAQPLGLCWTGTWDCCEDPHGSFISTSLTYFYSSLLPLHWPTPRAHLMV